MRMRSIPALALLAGTCLCSGVYADTYTWNFTGSGGAGSGSNTYTFNNSNPSGGPTVTATAWYVNGSNLLQRATVGQYSAGLGVCNTNESCSSPHHQVDNMGQMEFLLFQFSQPLSDISFSINPSPNTDPLYNGDDDPNAPFVDADYPDRDVTFFAGNSGSLPGDLLAGDNFGSIGGLYFNLANNVDVLSDTGTGGITVNLSFAGSATRVLFGALDLVNGTTSTNPLDFFKVTTMAGTTPTTTSEVPEPGSILLLGTILTGATFVIRRRRSPVR